MMIVKKDGGPEKNINVRWMDYSSGIGLPPQFNPDLSGSLTYTSGVTPRIWTGIIDVSIENDSSYATMSDLEDIWEQDYLYFKDETGNEFTESPFQFIQVIWVSDFVVEWSSISTNIAIVPFILLEVL